jgi:hypothetical protein
MQIFGIHYAKEHSYPVLKTCKAVHNKPMLAIFDKLGYTRDSQRLQYQNDITARKII